MDDLDVKIWAVGALVGGVLTLLIILIAMLVFPAPYSHTSVNMECKTWATSPIPAMACHYTTTATNCVTKLVSTTHCIEWENPTNGKVTKPRTSIQELLPRTENGSGMQGQRDARHGGGMGL